MSIPERVQMLALGLRLAIEAPTEAHSRLATNEVVKLASTMSEVEVKMAQALALADQN